MVPDKEGVSAFFGELTGGVKNPSECWPSRSARPSDPQTSSPPHPPLIPYSARSGFRGVLLAGGSYFLCWQNCAISGLDAMSWPVLDPPGMELVGRWRPKAGVALAVRLFAEAGARRLVVGSAVVV